MLFFAKPKPFLIDLFPDNHIDIHSHLLPAIDDGATSVEHSIALIESMQAVGIKKFITTPHIMESVWENTPKTIYDAKQTLEAALEKRGLVVDLQFAAEYMIDNRFCQLIQNGNLLTLKDNYVLVEMSYLNPPMALYAVLFELQVAGYIPVLAHPERYLFYYDQFSEYEKLKRAGCYFQLNANSTVGYYGKKVAIIAEKLLQKGMYDFIGTDVHHEKHVGALHQKVITKHIPELQKVIANNDFFK